MPSSQVWSKCASPASPHFWNQAPPRPQQLSLPDFFVVPHLEHTRGVLMPGSENVWTHVNSIATLVRQSIPATYTKHGPDNYLHLPFWHFFYSKGSASHHSGLHRQLTGISTRTCHTVETYERECVLPRLDCDRTHASKSCKVQANPTGDVWIFCAASSFTPSVAYPITYFLVVNWWEAAHTCACKHTER